MIKVLMLGNHPSDKGGMTSVISQINEYDWTNNNVKLSFIPTYKPGNAIFKVIFFAQAYLKILVKFLFDKPDIVHMHMSYKGSFERKYKIHKLCKKFHIKDIIHLHGSEFEKWYNQVDENKKSKIQSLLRECDSFIVLGEQWKSVVLGIEPGTKVKVIGNGISIPDKTVQWNENECQLLFLGVLIPRKGVKDLINALVKIKDQGLLKNLRLVIAGTGKSEDELKQQVMDQNLSDVVSFAGWVAGEKKKDLILDSQILVFPSYNEGLPISILEAASYGMPIIATDVGDIKAVVKNEYNGCLIKPGDVDSLSKAIIDISNNGKFREMSHNSRKIIEESFSISLFYEGIQELYYSLGK